MRQWPSWQWFFQGIYLCHLLCLSILANVPPWVEVKHSGRSVPFFPFSTLACVVKRIWIWSTSLAAVIGINSQQLNFLIVLIYPYMCLVTQSYLTLSNPMDCRPPGSSVYGILQARILEWVAIPFSRESSWPKDWTHIPCILDSLYCLGKPIMQGWGIYNSRWIIKSLFLDL